MCAISCSSGASEPLVLGRRVAEDHALGVRDRADVLHRPEVELRHEDLVVLAERVGVVEEPAEEVEALLRHLEQLGLVLLEVADQRAAAVEAERDAAMLVADDVVRPGDEGEQVRAEALRGCVAPPQAAVLKLLAAELRPVRDQLPVRGRVDRQVVAGLQVRLVEAGEEAVGVVRLEVAVEVLAAVLGVDELVEAVAGVVVLVLVAHAHDVARLQRQGGHGDAVLAGRALDLLAVDVDALDAAPAVVEEDARGSVIAGGVVEADRHVAAVGGRARDQVEVDLVADAGNKPRAGYGLVLAEDIARDRGVVGSHLRLGVGRAAARAASPYRGVEGAADPSIRPGPYNARVRALCGYISSRFSRVLTGGTGGRGTRCRPSTRPRHRW